MASKEPEVMIEIEWNYTPPDYFEEKTTWEREGYEIEMDGGIIIARLTATMFDSNPGLRDILTRELHCYFRGAQLVRRIPFEIHGGAINRIWPDGRRDTNIHVDPGELVVIGESVDLVFIDDKGVVRDTRRDRIQTTRSLAELSVRYCTADATARKILESLDGSVRDPDNEFVFLYEVLDALERPFGSKGKAGEVLGFSPGRLIELTCNLPLNQSRHRGLFQDGLRDATEAELDEARQIARDIALKYLRYLERRP